MGFVSTTTEAYQYPLAYEQTYAAALQAIAYLGRIPLGADPHRRVITYDTPMGLASWGETMTVGFIPVEGGTVVEVTATTKAWANLMQERRNRKVIGEFIAFLNQVTTSVGAPVQRA